MLETIIFIMLCKLKQLYLLNEKKKHSKDLILGPGARKNLLVIAFTPRIPNTLPFNVLSRTN